MFIALFLFLVSILLGAWRQYNGLIEAKEPYGVARAWASPIIRISSWIVVAMLSIWSCMIFSSSLQQVLGELIGQFMFGILIAMRWIISMGLGAKQYSKHYNFDELVGKTRIERDQ